MAHWQFRQLNPNDTSGTSTAEDNFAQEERTSVEILVRECIQNALDARHERENVVVRFDWKTISNDSRLVKDLLTESYCAQLASGGVASASTPNAGVPFLVIEDFGTTGLCGEYENSVLDGETENWNAFWFREGEGAKPTKSNGGAGQGKLTMYLASQLRTVVALTNRVTDGERLLFGSCRFPRNYVIANGRFAREARWGDTSDPNLLSRPIRDATHLDLYEADLGTARAVLPGSSFLIPMPYDSLNAEAVALAVVNEFYVPILRGRLAVTVGEEAFSSSTIAAQSKRLAKAKSLRISDQFLAFLSDVVPNHLSRPASVRVGAKAGSATKLDPEAIDSAELAASRAKFSAGEIVAAEISVRVTSITNEDAMGMMRVFLQDASDVNESEEVFIRRDLAIDKEKSLRGSKRLSPARALVLIDDEQLSKFLASAEEPTHREWNSARPKLARKYKNASATLRVVRNAASRLLELLSPTASRDSVALAAFFPDYRTHAHIVKAHRPKLKPAQDGADAGGADPPAPTVKKLELLPLDDGATIKVNPAMAGQCNFPLSCKLQLAYSVEVGDAMEDWDAADFFLTDTYKHQEGEAISNVKFDGNSVTFDVDGAESWFTVRGFDTKRRLDMRLRFSENRDASDQ